MQQAKAMAALLTESEAAMGKGKGKARADDHDGGTGTGTKVAPRQAAQDARMAEGANIKVDTQHNTSGVVSHSSGGSSSKGVNFMAFGLAPVVPGVWLGGAVMANAQPFQSSTDSRVQKTMSEPRVLRSDKGSVEMRRQVRYGVRVQPQDEGRGGRARTFSGAGSLMMRVPTEHLVPVTAEAPARPRPLSTGTARSVRLADSLAPVALDDAAAPHPGGGGLFDTVRSVLHPSLTSRGAPGRARLHDATSATTVLEDLPRLLSGWVIGEDLVSKDGSATGTYRMRADLTALSPTWTTGKTQLRTHQQAQHSVSHTAAKGRGGPSARARRRGSACWATPQRCARRSCPRPARAKRGSRWPSRRCRAVRAPRSGATRCSTSARCGSASRGPDRSPPP